ncbi:SH3 domain-containing C40 family peptidase [Sulfurimonas paralvinellae]|uniref:SH3 domain-containing C40 family peptidase n=1 Tax=Sulfurimonas paralvinellae TaxID=317658 RepID=UPI001D03FE7C|nr:SH3 domain-containing C40 family peptidase [Sulfurimonas paralvinellae]
MRYFVFIFIVSFFAGCAQKKAAEPETAQAELPQSVVDLQNVDQNVSAYVDTINERYIGSLESYEKHYFLPWNIDKIDISLHEAMWAYRAFRSANSYGENLQPLKASFFKDIYERSNFKDFSTLNKPAITLKRIDIRAFPTDKPLLMDPNEAGEGFPFDYMQNSTIAPNKPILVSHFSRDREWAFIEASFAYGWVKSRDIAFIPLQYAKLYQKAQKEFVMKESEPIYDAKGNFLFRSRIGMMLPEIDEKDDSFTILTIGNYKENEAYYIESNISKEILHKDVLKFNKENIAKILNEVMHVEYGWGGMYGQRDCSSMLRDFYAPFGLWLPRNSYEQGKVGKVVSFDGLHDEEKVALIKEEGIPFETLLYKKGHIMLYVGVKNDKVIIFQNTWGIKTKKDGEEGRFIIGKPIFSTLELGKELPDYDENASILRQLKSMNILTQSNN